MSGWQPGPDDDPEGSVHFAFSMWGSEYAVDAGDHSAIRAEAEWAVAGLRAEGAATERDRIHAVSAPLARAEPLDET